jgi:2-keto-4-pentenoate hydratase/2-oxohepta-3-ene-1,7-dioic acid hydratase in catechol pathway
MPHAILLPGNQRVTIGNLFVIGRNYIADPEARRQAALGNPVVTLKPTSAVILEGEDIVLPAFSSRVHFEIELTVLIGRAGKNIDEARALDHVLGYGVGLDLTASDLHEQAKQQGLPWTLCKGFDTAAPLSAFIEVARVPDPQRARFRLDVNGTPRQHGNAADMVFGIARIVSYLSQAFHLQPGDIIYTGTPAGAGPLARGDRLGLDYNDGQVRAVFRVA